MTNLENIEDCTDRTKPCPFCGNDENPHRTIMALWLAQLPVHYVKCESCAACGPISVEYPDKESAIAHWNRRQRVDLVHQTDLGGSFAIAQLHREMFEQDIEKYLRSLTGETND